MTKYKSKYLSKVVGQERAKEKLDFYVDSYLQGGVMPNILFAAARGNGKTLIARQTSKALLKLDHVTKKPIINPDTKKSVHKTIVEVNCGAIKSLNGFLEMFIEHVQDKDCTLFLDEAHLLESKSQGALLTLICPNPEYKTSFTHNDMTIDLNFRHQTVLLASSNPQKLSKDFLDRVKRVDLQEYEPHELGQILQLTCKDITFDKGLLDEISLVLRGNGRNATLMGEDINLYLNGKNKFTMKDWLKLKKILNIFPYGLTEVEISALDYILENNLNGTTLTALAAKMNMETSTVRRDVETHLLKNSLIRIEPTGRYVSVKGQAVLKEIHGK